MTTLIAVYGSIRLVGRCDAKCYEATEPACDCICGGRNHGAGFEQAVDNTRDNCERWLEQARDAGRGSTGAELGAPAAAEPLFRVAEVEPC